MGERAVIIAARRTPVAPRGGAFKYLQADELAAPVLQTLMKDARLKPSDVQHVLLGNALYGGGNPARLAALRAGIPQTVPALTVDTQCCSGLDAIILGARMIEAGDAQCVLAGGTESFSRAPVRMHSPFDPAVEPVPYRRPAFAPPPYCDPDLAEAAADLAERREYTRTIQAEYAVGSHQKARQSEEYVSDYLVDPLGTDLTRDTFTRALNLRTAMKAPILNGRSDRGLSAATIACEADAAAAVLLLSERCAEQMQCKGLSIVIGKSAGWRSGPSGLGSNWPRRRHIGKMEYSLTCVSHIRSSRGLCRTGDGDD